MRATSPVKTGGQTTPGKGEGEGRGWRVLVHLLPLLHLTSGQTPLTQRGLCHLTASARHSNQVRASGVRGREAAKAGALGLIPGTAFVWPVHPR